MRLLDTMRPRDRFEWILLGVLALPFVVFAVLKPNVVTSTLKSPEGVVRLAAITVGVVLLWWVLHRFVGQRELRAVLFAVPVLALAGFMIIPSYQDETVDEDLAVVAPSATTTTAGDTGPTTTAGRETPATTEPSIVQVSSGALVGIDHDAVGTVGIHERSDGSAVIFFEDDTDIEPGPDYDVYLVPGEGATTPDGGTFLDDIKGNQGSQNYEVPADYDLSGDHTVLVWCESFGVPIAHAPQQSV